MARARLAPLLVATVGVLYFGIAAATGATVFGLVYTAADEDGIPWPLRRILRLNERVDGSRSRLALVAPDGIEHAIKLSQQTSPDSLLATVPNLISGKYQLHWQVLAGDGHITQGKIPFTVVVP